MKYSFCTSLALVAFSSAIFAQSDIRIEVSGSFVSNQPAGGLYANWNDGWALSGGVSYPFTERTDFLFEARYSHLPYQGNNLELAFPAIAGLRWSVNGLPTNVYETSAGIRFKTHGTFIRPFLALRGGIVVMDIGRITISQWFESQPQNISHGTYQNTGTQVTRALASIGVGAIFSVIQNLSLLTEARCVTLFGADQIFVPLTITGQFQL